MIKATDISKKFGDFRALDHLSCEIPRGCIYGMVGSNGAGKSTFLRLIAGVYKADGGTVTIDDQPVYENPAMKARIAYVPDELYFLQGATMNRMADLYAASYPQFDRGFFKMLTGLFRLDPAKPIHNFSKGMRRQAATILSLACRPDYIFFDETFDGLDPVMRQLVKQLICDDVAQRQATAIITSHSLRELEDTCDQLALLHQGGIVLQSDVQNLKTNLFKIQAAFATDMDRQKFEGLDVLQYQKRGSVVTMIVRGNRDATVARLQAMMPLLLDVLPLTLEEVFTYEMEAIGYVFDMSEVAK